MVRFTLRDIFLATLVACIAAAWCGDHYVLAKALAEKQAAFQHHARKLKIPHFFTP